jgi:hypothetical protein
MNTQNIHNLLIQKQSQLEWEQNSYKETLSLIQQEKDEIELLEKCKSLVMELGKSTQKQIKQYIDDTVTLALQPVYGHLYKFVVKFEYNKRGRSEVYFFIDKGGKLLELRKNTTGGGVVDLCAFSLRMILWTLDDSKKAPPIMIMDEPFKNVSWKFLPDVTKVVKKISELLEIQFIIATHKHNKAIIETADTAYYIGGEPDDEY